MAMASENSARGQPNSSPMGIWNTPKLARMAKPSIMMKHPTSRTGVKSEGVVLVMGGRSANKTFASIQKSCDTRS